MFFIFICVCLVSLVLADKCNIGGWLNLYPIAGVVIASFSRYSFISKSVNEKLSVAHKEKEEFFKSYKVRLESDAEQRVRELAREHKKQQDRHDLLRHYYELKNEENNVRAKSLEDECAQLQKRKKEIDSQLLYLNQEREEFEKFKDIALQHKVDLSKEMKCCNRLLKNIGKDDVLLTQVYDCLFRIQNICDSFNEDELLMRKVPAIRAEEKVREANKRARIAEREFLLAKRRVDLYEWYAPWLAECTDCSLQDLLNEIRNPTGEQVEDPVRVYLKDKTQDEWNTMDEASRNQLALERYWSRRRYGPWEAGIQYERFVGYVFEKKGYDVEYHGAIAGKMDHGIDLIARKDGKVLVIQCKRLSQDKGIPVRENVIAQVYGAAKFYALQNGYSGVQPLLFTSFEVSEDARKFADLLGVYVKERFEMKPYPCIKCNAGKDGSKIYHLPFDQLYDRVKIKAGNGEFYASTAHEAEDLGFRRAWRWRGE